MPAVAEFLKSLPEIDEEDRGKGAGHSERLPDFLGERFEQGEPHAPQLTPLTVGQAFAHDLLRQGASHRKIGVA